MEVAATGKAFRRCWRSSKAKAKPFEMEFKIRFKGAINSPAKE
jgi:hypothetical protein